MKASVAGCFLFVVIVFGESFEQGEIMSLLSILLVVIYAAFFASAFIAYIILTLVVYEDNVGIALSQENDSFDVFFIIPRMLGVFRFSLLCVMAILWPISFSVLLILCLPHRRAKCFEEFPLYAQRALLWIFLGFGKFTPDPNYVPVPYDSCE